MPRLSWETRLPEGGESPTLRDFIALQEEMDVFISQFYEEIPLADGILLKDIVLEALQDNVINHKLERQLQGWYVARREKVDCAFSVRRDAADTGIAASTPHLITFDTVDDFLGGSGADAHNLGSVYDTSNGKFIAPVDGHYRFEAFGGFASLDAANSEIYIYKNGTLEVRGTHDFQGSTSSNNTANYVTLDTFLAKDDTIQVYVQHDDGAARDLLIANRSARFSGYLVKDPIEENIEGNGDLENQLILRSSYKHTVHLWVY